VSNSILASNTAATAPDLSGPVDAHSSYNLIGDGSGSSGIADGTNGNQVGTAASPIDPLLGPLADNGGPTQTMALLAGSPALGTGGPGTTLTAAVDDTATTLSVDHAPGLAVTPGLTILLDSEQMTITGVDVAGNTFTVLRGVNGTTATAHDAGTGLYTVTDQRGVPRVAGGQIDIGAWQTQAEYAPPVVSVSLDHVLLWPADGTLVNVGLHTDLNKDADPTTQIRVRVYGDGGAGSDDAVLGPDGLQLRASWSGHGLGRVYLIVVTATDSQGRSSFAVTTVVVPAQHNPVGDMLIRAKARASEIWYEMRGAVPPGFSLLADGLVR
jgi:hypothetical protein